MRMKLLGILIMLILPLLVGFAIGYSVHPSTEAPSRAEGLTYIASAPAGEDTVDLPVSRRNAITRAVSKVSPAVVGINVIEIREQRIDPFFRRFFEDPIFDQFFRRRFEVRGLGSGFVVSSDGYIVTNHHVAGNATKITVTMTDGKRLDAELVGTDPIADIAVLKVKGNGLPTVTLGNSDGIIVGEWAVAFGNPFGLFEINDKPTVTVGVISSTGMNLGQVGDYVYRDMVETDAAINSGNSGGPLANADGEIIGMNTLIFTGGQTNTFVGYGFAIPINKVKRILDEIRRTGTVSRDYNLGFTVQKVDARIARYFRMREAAGVIVSELQTGSPADKAGLQVGDIILTLNGENVNSEEQFLMALSDKEEGATLTFGIFRQGKTVEISMKFRRR